MIHLLLFIAFMSFCVDFLLSSKIDAVKSGVLYLSTDQIVSICKDRKLRTRYFQTYQLVIPNFVQSLHKLQMRFGEVGGIAV
jgi:hypothetical protein